MSHKYHAGGRKRKLNVVDEAINAPRDWDNNNDIHPPMEEFVRRLPCGFVSCVELYFMFVARGKDMRGKTKVGKLLLFDSAMQNATKTIRNGLLPHVQFRFAWDIHLLEWGTAA